MTMTLLLMILIGIGSFFAGRYSAPPQHPLDGLQDMLKKQLEETHEILEQGRTLVEYLYNQEKED